MVEFINQIINLNKNVKFLLISDFDVADESSVCIVGREGEKKGL